MKRYIHSVWESDDSLNDIIAMANLRGRKIKNPHKLPFSFYFSGKQGSHDIRVKPIFNPDKMMINKAGNLKLNGDWDYTPGSDDKNVRSSDVAKMKEFFRKYLVLFCAVWDLQLPDTTVQDYFEGDIDLAELVKDLSFYQDNYAFLDTVHNIEDLEEVCREHDFVNFHGN